MKRRTLFAAFMLTLMSLVLLTGRVSRTAESRVMAAPEFQKEPLFQFHNKRGRDLYKRGAMASASQRSSSRRPKVVVTTAAIHRQTGEQQ